MDRSRKSGVALRLGAFLRVGGFLRRSKKIFSIPPKARIQTREGLYEVAGDDFRDAVHGVLLAPEEVDVIGSA